MQESLAIRKLNLTDLNMYQCGTEDCSPGYYYGPAIRDHFLVHYILKGRGEFHADGRVYNLQKDQGFLICPDKVTYYQANIDDPWSYSWVGFHGLKAEAYLKSAGLGPENPVFTYDRDDFIHNCFSEMISAKDLRQGREMRLLGLLYLFLSQLVEVNGSEKTDFSANREETYIKKAIEFIGMNYPMKISVEDIARHTGLDRSYLGSIFRKRLDTTLQDFLINYRIDRACELMKNESFSIGDISRSVGYDDPLLFSKTFKKRRNLSPRQYRKNLFPT